MRYGEQIGTIDHGRFLSGNRAWRYLDMSETERYNIIDIQALDTYLRGEPIINDGVDGAVLVVYQNQILVLEYRK